MRATGQHRIAIGERGQGDRKLAGRITEIACTGPSTFRIPLVYPAPQDGIVGNALVIVEIAASLTASNLIPGHAGETDLLPADDPA